MLHNKKNGERFALTALWLGLGLMAGLAAARPALAQASPGWHVAQSVTNPSGTTFVLWTKAGATDAGGNYAGDLASVWTVDGTGHETAIGPTYGPYPSWRASQISANADGTVMVQWNHVLSGGVQASIWHMDGAGRQLSIGPTYGPYTGWTPGGLQPRANGTSSLYWSNFSSGGQQLSIWTVDSSGRQLSISQTYGSYPGWITAGSSPSPKDGSVFVSWVKSGTTDANGNYSGDQLSIWKTDAAGNRLTISPTYGPYPGWRFGGLSPAPDGSARLLWSLYGATDVHGTYSGDTVSLWDVDSNGTQLAIGPTYGPYTGWSAVGLAVAADNSVRLEWTHQSDKAYDGTYSSKTTGSDGYTRDETDTVSNGTVTGHQTFTNGSQSGSLDWTGTITPAGNPYAGASLTGSGTISFNGTRSFTVSRGDISLDPDGSVRLSWAGTDPATGSLGGKTVRQTLASLTVSIWSLDATGHQLSISPTYGPYAGWSAASGLTTLPDGTERLFWQYSANSSDNYQGTEFSLWSLNSANSSPTYGPNYGPFP